MAPSRFQLSRISRQKSRLWRQNALLLGCSLWLSLCPLRCDAFNLDTKYLVIKKGKTADSFFGLSVALHHQTNPQRYLLLTGAPQDVAEEMVNGTRTGAMYSCPLSAVTNDCTRVEIKVPNNPQSNVVKDMWLGVTVASQRAPTGRVMACAHRYIRILKSGFEPQYRMVGNCYIRGNNLTFQKEDVWQANNPEMCNANIGFEGTGMCQMGISGGFTANTVYFGAPGAYHWQGTNYMIHREYEQDWEEKGFDYPDQKNSHSYLGYSIESGTAVLHKQENTIITGAPRNNHIGAVFLMANDNIKTLQNKLMISGEQVGSYFGSSIALADLNMDGWQDLIVGAPYYFNRKEEKGGAVYIYMNLGGTFHSSPTITLTGPSSSSFGHAVANIGDVNKDGFQDIAIGAPFEGSGKVYIYHSGVGGLIKKPQQIISGEDIGPGIKTFGYSFSGGMDVDGNSYPDLLVGTLSENIVLLRTRPVINILNKTFVVTPETLDPAKCTQDSCIKIEFCFSFSQSAGDPKYKETINLNYTVKADLDHRPSRVHFAGTKSENHTGVFSMPATKCKTLEVLLRSNMQDKLSPIAFSINYSLAQEEREFKLGLLSLDPFPVLNEDQPRENHTVIQFQKECGPDNICNSNLQIQASFFNDQNQELPRRNGMQVLHYSWEAKKLNLNLVISVTNAPTSPTNGEDAHDALLNITFPPFLQFSSVRPSGACTLEETVKCKLGNPFKKNQKANLTITFQVDRTTLSTEDITVQVEPSTMSNQKDLTPVEAVLLMNYTIASSLTVSKDHQSSFSGKVMGESAMKHEEDVGSPLEFDFKVTTEAESLGSLGTITLGFKWPYEASNGKWLLYPTTILVKGNGSWFCEPPGHVINYLNLTLINHSNTLARRKRELQASPKAELPITLASTKKATSETSLNCSTGTLRCIWFECPLGDIGNETDVKVRARVWNSTFIEDFNDFDRVKVEGHAILFLRTNTSTINMKNYSIPFFVNIDSELSEQQPVEIELWLVLVAVTAGLLLLGFIVLLLWKCGFFRRANTRAMYEAKGQKAMMRIQPSETKRLTDSF